MKKALVVASNDEAQALRVDRERSSVDLEFINLSRAKHSRQDAVEKRAAYIYPKIIKAINNDTRRRIIVFLKRNKQLSFTELKAALGGAQNASLSRHLNILQRAWLIERRVDLGSPRIAKDPYYSFYSLSEFGTSFLSHFSNAITQSADLSPSNKQEPKADK
ncbi:MAG: helix-turn-helix domain-containing protein [Nitrospiraceae bacterium]|nr:helix-turn-helix domain-containing protein [Nitrospiraceae bacterium]